MVKMIIDIDDEINKKLKFYVNKKYPLTTHGKIKMVIEDAIEEYMKTIQ